MKRNLVAAVLLLVLANTLTACTGPYPRYYSAEAIEASIVDADTRQPLEGVVAVAHWPLLGGIEGNRPIAQLMVMEAVSDENGRVFFPAWGPLRRPLGHIRHEDPTLLLFKSGYRYRVLGNRPEGWQDRAAEPLRRSDWNGKTIEMRKFTGTVEEYAKHVERLYYSLDHIATDQPEDCNWKKLPKTIVALAEERKVLEEQGINPHTIPSLDNRLLTNDEYFTRKGGRSCGSPKAFLRSIVP